MVVMATRSNQKERTRRAIIAAAGRLVDAGTGSPTIDEVADEALVSRATVYRYFESTDDLLWQLYSDRHVPDPERLMAVAGDDLTERVLVAEKNVNDYLFDDADGTRAFERVMLERRLEGRSTDHDRPGRRFVQIDAALAPLEGRLEHHQLLLVRHALALAIGSQGMVALLDTAALDADAAREVTRFACAAIVNEAERLAASVGSVGSAEQHDPAPA